MRTFLQPGLALLLAALAALVTLATLSGPARAHGDEPHGDEPHPPGTAAPALPRLEAATDLFELVARLEPAALVLFINRFESSEPVLQAEVELETGTLQARAVFDPALGSYAVDDAAFLAALHQPGRHALVLTVTAGDEADLLEGVLEVADTEQGHAHGPGEALLAAWPVALGVAAGLAAGAGTAWWLRRRRPALQPAVQGLPQ